MVIIVYEGCVALGATVQCNWKWKKKNWVLKKNKQLKTEVFVLILLIIVQTKKFYWN